MFMAELASALPVDVMPGAEDLANVALPQQPLHKWVAVACFRSFSSPAF